MALVRISCLTHKTSEVATSVPRDAIRICEIFMGGGGSSSSSRIGISAESGAERSCGAAAAALRLRLRPRPAGYARAFACVFPLVSRIKR